MSRRGAGGFFTSADRSAFFPQGEAGRYAEAASNPRFILGIIFVWSFSLVAIFIGILANDKLRSTPE